MAELLDQATALFQRWGKGRGTEVMRPPFAPLVWPANMLAERRQALTGDMTVSTGSLSPAEALQRT